MFFKYNQLPPAAQKELPRPIHFDTEFDIWQSAGGFHLLTSPAMTPVNFPGIYEARAYALQAIAQAKAAAVPPVPVVPPAPAAPVDPVPAATVAAMAG